MKRPIGAKKWLAVCALVFLTPALLAAKPDKKKGCDASSFRSDKKCQQVPEGGAATGYLLAVGAMCLGAVFVRSRFSSSSLS
jgi:hypothetical protein